MNINQQIKTLLYTFVVAAMITTLVIPRNGVKASDAVRGWFDIASNASRSTLGVRKPSSGPVISTRNQMEGRVI